MKKLFAVVFFLGAISFWACQKELSYESDTDTASAGTWEFKDSVGTTFSGNSQTLDTTTALAASPLVMLYTGVTANGLGLLSININFPTRTPATGTYSSALGQVDFSYSVGAKTVYEALSATQFSTENITVVISQVTDTSITGTFSGTALDSTSATTKRVKIIKEGKFSFKKRGTSTTPVVPVSAGSLGTTTDTCTGAVISGTYRKATAVTSNNTVTVTATVTATGSYTIYSDTIKGIYFRSAATFTNTGTQSVVIPALGTPTDSGTVRFRLHYGTSSCTFQVKIDTSNLTTITIQPTGDYFPTTAGRNWYYDDYDETGFFDTGYTRSTAQTITSGGNTYTRFIQDENGILDTSYYRENSGIYYTLEDLSTYGGPSAKDIIILKDNVPVNSSWTDSLVTAGITIYKVTSTIIAKNVSASVTTRKAIVTSSDVIKVRTTLTSLVLAGATLTSESWYANGGGLMYGRISYSNAPNQFNESRLSRYN